MKKKVYLTAYLMFVISLLFGQSSSISGSSNRLIPPSPTASSLGAFGELNVSYYTGTVPVNISLAKLSNGDANLNVSLDGAARAIKVSEVPSWVGSGWSLSCGGVITRMGSGLPDDLDSYGYLNRLDDVRYFGNSIESRNTGFSNTRFNNLLDAVINNTFDIQPDIFYFNFNGYSGKFFIDDLGVPRTQSFQNIIFEFQQSQAAIGKGALIVSNFIDKWIAKTPDGFKFYFEAKEWTYSDQDIATQNVSIANVSSWYLSRIESPNGNEIFFEYTDPVPQSKLRVQRSVFDKIYMFGCNANGNQLLGQQASGPTQYLSEPIYLKRVYCDNFTVEFFLSIRNDLYEMPKGNQEEKKLDRIDISNSLGTLVKRFSFSYIEQSDKRLQLSSLLENGGSPYVFEYNSYIPVGFTSRSIDHWGYYNGKVNTSLIPITSVYIPGWISGNYGWADRSPNLSSSLLGSLKMVTYPTGGTSVFEYEQHSYSYINSEGVVDPGQNHSAGGLRIKRIVNSDALTAGNSNNIVREFDYTQYQDGVSSGTVGSVPNYYMYIYGIASNCCSRIWWLQSATVFPLSMSNGNFVVYKHVRETRSDGAATAYTFKTFADQPDGSIVYSHPLTGIAFDGTTLQMAPREDMDHFRGMATKVAVFKSGSSIPVKENIIGYTSPFSVNSYKKRYYSYTPVPSPGNCSFPQRVWFPIILGYNHRSDWIYKSSEIEKSYLGTGQIVTTQTNYFYDNPIHGQLTRVEKSNSQNKVERSIFRYPGDDFNNPVLTQSEQEVLNQMMTDRRFSEVVDEERFVGNISMNLKRNIYRKEGGTNFIKPDKVLVRTLSNQFKESINYNKFQSTKNGKILELTGSDRIKVSYIWDYQNSYPIAEVTNSSYDEVAYTSFEAEGKGNFDFLGTPLAGSSVTGRKSYDLSTGSISKTGLRTSNIYYISYWSKSSSPYTLSGANILSVTTRLTNNGWTLFEHKFSNSSGITLSGSGEIDEVRLLPAAAKMTSYTYEPLVGITSQNDVNNVITYYEYDSYGRLSFIRDFKRNLLRQICYKFYSQSLTPCTGQSVYFSEYQSRTFNPSSCPPEYLAQPYEYRVPAGKYQSFISQQHANQLAINEILTNGQASADTYGCILPCPGCSEQGVMYKCVNGQCEAGIKVYTDSWYEAYVWICEYHYVFSDGSVSSSYLELSGTSCL